MFAEPEARAGGYYGGFLRVSYGCGTSPTVELRVEIPEAILSARPQPKPGWTLILRKAPLPQPFTSEGGARVTERVASVTWRGLLPVDQFDQFGLMLKLPANAGPLYFPVLQRQSGENAWTEIPANPAQWHDLNRPAPMLMLGEPEHAGHARH